MLRAATGTTWLLGPRWGHLAGQEVVVTGTPQHGLLTTAQQGTPLAVAEVTTLDGTRLHPVGAADGR